MSEAVLEIKNKVSRILTRESKITNELSEDEKINHFLDSILDFKKSLKRRTEKLRHIDELLSEFTWVEQEMTANDEKMLKKLFDSVDVFHKKAIVYYANMRTIFWKHKIARQELSDFKGALDDIEESNLEVRQILFDIRKDDDFMNEIRKIA